MKAAAVRALGGQVSPVVIRLAPGLQTSVAKLYSSRTTRLSRDVAVSVAGAGAVLSGSEAPLEGSITELLLFSPAASVGASR